MNLSFMRAKLHISPHSEDSVILQRCFWVCLEGRHKGDILMEKAQILFSITFICLWFCNILVLNLKWFTVCYALSHFHQYSSTQHGTQFLGWKALPKKVFESKVTGYTKADQCFKSCTAHKTLKECCKNIQTYTGRPPWHRCSFSNLHTKLQNRRISTMTNFLLTLYHSF